MKKFAAFLAVTVIALFSAGLVIGATAPEKISIDFVKKSKSAVDFSHKKHADNIKNCKECHHKSDAGKEGKCSSCHKAKAEGKTPDFKEAMHTKCRDCHKKMAKGPTKCDDCHKK